MSVCVYHVRACAPIGVFSWDCRAPTPHQTLVLSSTFSNPIIPLLRLGQTDAGRLLLESWVPGRHEVLRRPVPTAQLLLPSVSGHTPPCLGPCSHPQESRVGLEEVQPLLPIRPGPNSSWRGSRQAGSMRHIGRSQGRKQEKGLQGNCVSKLPGYG